MQSAIDSIAAIAAMQPGIAVSGTAEINAAPNAQGPNAFANLLQQQLGELNASVGTAEASMRDLAAGKPVELHEVMISLERARISVQTFIQVRNRLIESYQDLIRMQI